MVVPMMKIGVMRMFVAHRFMIMPMGVWLPGRVAGFMRVPMMGVVNVAVFVIQRFMRMFVIVRFSQMQIYA